MDMNTDEECTELECPSETPLVESDAAVVNTGVTVEQASSTPLNTLSSQIGQALKDIQATRQACSKGSAATQSAPSDLINRVTKLEGEKSSLNKNVKSLENTVAELTKRLAALECVCKGQKSAPAPKAAAAQDDDDDDDVDLFGSDDDEEEDDDAKRVREERLAAYADKKSKKAGPIAKSSVLLDCKPWDDETDMKEMEKLVREIQMDGLVWGAAKTVPLAFGIEKLSILCIVEDAKVSIDDLIEKIQENEDYVQSVDIGAFNKI